MPLAPRGWACGGVIPSPLGEVSGEGAVPLSRKFFVFFVEAFIEAF